MQRMQNAGTVEVAARLKTVLKRWIFSTNYQRRERNVRAGKR